MSVRAYAMHVYLYLDATRQVDLLPKLREACRALGMIDEETLPFVSPDGVRPSRLLSAPGSPGIVQALEYGTARLNAFLVCLAPNDGTSWRELDKRWRETAGPVHHADCTGRVRLFYALYDGDSGLDQLTEAVRAALPSGSMTLKDQPTLPAPGFYLWEARSDAGDRMERVLALLAPSTQEHVSDAWVWPSGQAALPPLPGYLWEMAKIRHEARRFEERRLLSRQERLYDHAARFEAVEQSETTHTKVREGMLQALQRETALAAAGVAILRTMHRTVDAASDNCRKWLATWEEKLPTAPGDSAWAENLSGPIEEDRRDTNWLLTEITDTADTVRDIVEYARPMAQIGAAELEERLRELSERGEFLTALQTSVIAAVGLALAAAQATRYEWPTYASLQTPFIVCVASAGLFLPLTAVLRRSTRHPWRRRIWVGLTGAGLAASVSWLLVTFWSRWQDDQPASPAVTVLLAAVAAIGAVAMAWSIAALRSRWVA